MVREVVMRRIILGIVIASAVLSAAGVALALGSGPSPQPVRQLVVQGRVTGSGGMPVSGIKVWLNAWPKGAWPKEVPVTVVSSAITSATGRYAIWVSSPAVLAPQAMNGIVRLGLMTGNSTGWDAFDFPGRLVQTAAGTELVIGPGGSSTVDLQLTQH
jgi:hypothetical protein